MKPQPAPLGEPVPETCLVIDVLRHLNMSRATFDRRMARGQLPLVELPRYGGPKSQRRFTGSSVEACKRSRWAPAKLRRVG